MRHVFYRINTDRIKIIYKYTWWWSLSCFHVIIARKASISFLSIYGYRSIDLYRYLSIDIDLLIDIDLGT